MYHQIVNNNQKINTKVNKNQKIAAINSKNEPTNPFQWTGEADEYYETYGDKLDKKLSFEKKIQFLYNYIDSFKQLDTAKLNQKINGELDFWQRISPDLFTML